MKRFKEILLKSIFLATALYIIQGVYGVKDSSYLQDFIVCCSITLTFGIFKQIEYFLGEERNEN